MPSAKILKTNVSHVPWGIVLLALTPAALIFLPWDFGPNENSFRAFMRMTKLPVAAVEFIFVFVAMSRGFAPLTALLALPPLAKLGLAMLSFSSVWTTVLVAAVPTAALLGFFKFFAHALFALAIFHVMSKWTMQHRKMIWPATGLGVVGFCLLWGANIAIYSPKGNDWFHLVPSMTTMRSVGPYALACYCAGVGMLNANSDPRSGRLGLVIAILFGSLGFALAGWTGTRAAILAILVATGLAVFVLPNRKQLITMLFASAVIGLGIASVLPVVHPSYGILRMLGDSIQPAHETGISSGRVDIWINMLNKIVQRPMMGWGIDQFRFSFPTTAESVRHPHNGAMQLIFSTGLWGITATAMIAVSFVREIPNKLTEPYQFAALVFVIGATAYGLYDGIFYFSYPIMIFAVAGVCLVVAKPQAASDKSD
jgi:exopolysaccharide production protein ExoQ